MSTLSRLPLYLLLPIAIGGCANWESIHHEFGSDGSKSVSVDAKQRFLILGTRKGYQTGNTVVPDQLVTCAEPSPDAFSVIGASFSGSASEVQKLALNAAAGTSETGSTLGSRTQTIQILRDAMFRLCEGYQAGALSPNAFERLQRRYQNAMLGFLAIEQLSGVVVPKQTVISASAPALTASPPAAAPAPAPAANSPAAPGAGTAAPSADKAAAPTVKTANFVAGSSASDGARAPKTVLASDPPSGGGTDSGAATPNPGSGTNPGSTSAPATTFNNAANGRISDQLGTKVAEIVQQIVKEVLGVNYSGETCLNFLVDAAGGNPVDQDVVAYCKQTLGIPNTFSSTSTAPQPTMAAPASAPAQQNQ
jgi:hypothetical protein